MYEGTEIMTSRWDNQGTDPLVFYSLCYVTAAQSFRSSPLQITASAQEDAVKLITDVRFSHRAVVDLPAIYPSLPGTKFKPKQSKAAPFHLPLCG